MVSNLKAETRQSAGEIASETLGSVGYCRCVDGFIPASGIWIWELPDMMSALEGV